MEIPLPRSWGKVKGPDFDMADEIGQLRLLFHKKTCF